MFIIRPGKSSEFPYALSVRGVGTEIAHYLVGYNRSSDLFYLTPHITFPTMETLLNHYKSTTIDGRLGLTKPRLPRVNPPLKLNDCKYDLGELKILEKLGSGRFGVVSKAQFGNVLMAVKRFRGVQCREAQMMLVLQHPSIVQFLGIAEDPNDNSVIIMLEFMANGSLKHYLTKLGKSKFTYDDLIKMADRLAQGMVYLESLDIVHMELRADNILVNKEGVVKISDFGLAQILGSDMNNKIEHFPARWTAPEIMLGETKCTTKCDVWSFGVLMFEILTCGMQPYEDLKTDEVKEAVLNGRRLPSPTKYGFECHSRIYSLMQSCWDVDPQKRPTFREIHANTRDSIINENMNYTNAVCIDED
ncbi:unnamed protein product [Rodentolepis nana]|uniref:Non-specific protein-tyrosine kinase n=1 Tax=Rodentolepis nana TaxID=102285 RepID=A0A0R3TG20_RODNA|nr:unnamed protein product [Rodentolepis nana]